MGKHAKEETNRAGQAEVLTGHDEKAERESPDRRGGGGGPPQRQKGGERGKTGGGGGAGLGAGG